MKFINKPILFSAVVAAILSSCGGSSEILSTPITNIDNTPIKEQELTESEKHNWGHLDLVKDTIPGMSVDKAYTEIVKDKKGKKIIVAVIDSGIDISHEDLDGVLWTNSKEIPGNGIDDDKNGYIDDIHGWNFLGTGYDEQLEYVRIVASGDTTIPRYAEAKALLEKERAQVAPTKQRYEQIYGALKDADEAFTKHFGKADYTNDEVKNLDTKDETLLKHKAVAAQMNGFGLPSIQEAKEELKGALDGMVERLNTNLNPEFSGRKTGDNPNDFNDKPGYGDANVMPIKKSESHGTHVAGIILAERNNGKGANGIANNAELMSVRVVPNGDEYDKDVAKGIRYAVDNGANIINGSFGKSFSQQSEWVRDAIKYASDNNVIFVHAAGNDSKDVDLGLNFPDDNTGGAEISNTYIRVGALGPKYGTDVVARFSNYGQKNVDVFAPGAQIYSTFPENEYKSISGTSMASPGVAGVAALVWSQYPKLTAAQVKLVILTSGVPISTKVVVGGNSEDVRPFSELSKSGKMVNAYNALIMASKMK
jgi:subtilisin family serine protease